MDPKLQSDISRDVAAVAEQAGLLDAAIESRVLDIHTAMPGTVISFDATAQTCRAQPAIQRVFRETGPVDLPEVVDLPVQFPRGGDYVLTFPVKAGDECLLIFSERCIDGWFAKGGSQPPSEYRTHDLSDACAIMGISSTPKKVSGFSTSAVELRRLDGAAKVSIEGQNIIATSTTGNVLLNAPPGANALLNGVVVSGDPCPILGLTLGALGCGASRVFAGKT